jgi:hypothetical protein
LTVKEMEALGGQGSMYSDMAWKDLSSFHVETLWMHVRTKVRKPTGRLLSWSRRKQQWHGAWLLSN